MFHRAFRDILRHSAIALWCLFFYSGFCLGCDEVRIMEDIKVDVSEALVSDDSSIKEAISNVIDGILPNADTKGSSDVFVESVEYYDKFFPGDKETPHLTADNVRAITTSREIIGCGDFTSTADFENHLASVKSNLHAILNGNTKRIILYSKNNSNVLTVDKEAKTIAYDSKGDQYDIRLVDAALKKAAPKTCKPQTLVTQTRDILVLGAEATLSAYHDYDELPLDLPPGWSLVERFEQGQNGIKERVALLLKKGDDYMVVIRGVTDMFDFMASLTDSRARFTPYKQNNHRLGSVTLGIYELYTSFRGDVLKALSKAPRIKNLHIAGHSLGATMSYMLAYDIMLSAKFRSSLGLGGLKFKLSVTSMAAPKFADEEFRDAYTILINRYRVKSATINNSNDIVPALPPLSWAATPMPHELVISFGIPYDFRGCHSLKGYIAKLRSLPYIREPDSNKEAKVNEHA